MVVPAKLRGMHASNQGTDRRDLLRNSAAVLGGAGLAACASPGAAPAAREREAPLKLGRGAPLKLLFQGDSITDAGRSREAAAQPNLQSTLGGGYAWLAAGGLLVQAAEERLRVYNRGVSGDKVHQLAARWEPDCLALEPDVLSILIGVNDIWHARGGDYDGTVETYERDYDALLARTRAALPSVRLILCEPFVLRCGAVDASWFPEFDDYRAAARRMADKHRTAWVPFQQMFDRAVRYAPAEHWAQDGVHPSPAGAALMAQTWSRVALGSEVAR